MFRIAMFGFVVCFGVPASAEPFRIERTGVAYWSDSDAVEVRVEFNRPPDLPVDFLAIALIVDKPPPQLEWIAYGGDGPIGSNIMLTRHVFNGIDQFQTFIGEYPYSVSGNTLTAVVPFSPMGLDAVPPTFNVMAGEARPFGIVTSYEGNPVRIDELIMAAPVPEPSTFALAGCATMAAIGSRRWLRKKR